MSGQKIHKVVVNLAETNDMLSEIEEGVFDCLDAHGLVEGGYLFATFQYSETPNPTRSIRYCTCGNRGDFFIGDRWYCHECYYNGDDEDTHLKERGKI